MHLTQILLSFSLNFFFYISCCQYLYSSYIFLLLDHLSFVTLYFPEILAVMTRRFYYVFLTPVLAFLVLYCPALHVVIAGIVFFPQLQTETC